MPRETLVMEEDDTQLLWIDGLLPLPIGTVINLDNISGHPQVPLDSERFPNGHADAVVTELHLWGTQGDERVLVLKVKLLAPGSPRAMEWSV